MKWYIHKGEDLRRDQIVKFSFFHDIDLNHRPRDLVFMSDLKFSENDVASIYPDPNVKVACQLKADLRDVDKSLFKSKTSTYGQPYLEVHYDLILSTAEANLKCSLEIDGKEMGSIGATYV